MGDGTGMTIAFIHAHVYKSSGRIDDRNQYRGDASLGSRRAAPITNGYQKCHLISIMSLYNANQVDSIGQTLQPRRTAGSYDQRI